MSKRLDERDGSKRLGGVDYSKVVDRQIGDSRFERERGTAVAAHVSKSSSSTFDAFHRMAAGLEGRTLSDKIADPNRPTWDQYKKDNESKLDMVGDDVRKMVEYRSQLDREREERLRAGGKRHMGPNDSDSDSDSQDSDRHRRKKHKKESSSKKSHKKESKRKSSGKHSSKERKRDKKERKSRNKDKKDSKQHSRDSDRDSASSGSDSASGSDESENDSK